MLTGFPQAAGKVALGVAGVTVLATSAHTVAILAESVRRALSHGCHWVSGTTPPHPNAKPAKDEWDFRDFTPYSRIPDWQSLGWLALKNVVVGTAALYIANKYCPSLVTNANALLHHVVPIQFTPSHIPLTNYLGL
jgi:hypothetical protein